MSDKKTVAQTVRKDERTISSLAIDYNQRVHDWNVIVGNYGVTKIEVYDEYGSESYVPVVRDLRWRGSHLAHQRQVRCRGLLREVTL